MKKIILILLFAGLVYAGKAHWTVHLYNAQFGNGTAVEVEYEYGGQSVIALLASGGVADKTEDLLEDVTFTGVDSVYAGKTYYQIEPIPFWPTDLVWLSIEDEIHIVIE